MSTTKLYRNSLLAILCIISWVVIVFRIFNSYNNSDTITQLARLWPVIISLGIIGGIILHFYGILKSRNIKYSFRYNLIATFNLLVGCLGVMQPVDTGKPVPYLIVAGLAVGLLMYKNIYSKRRWEKLTT